VGARDKEVIGDALRNAGMRFGAALALWHKGELHVEEPADKEDKPKDPRDPLTAPRGSAREVTTEAFNGLTVPEQESLRSKLQSIIDAWEVDGIVKAYDVLMEQQLDTEGQLAMSALMDSPLRNQLKVEGVRRRELERKREKQEAQ
jgi:hypothetical protein